MNGDMVHVLAAAVQAGVIPESVLESQVPGTEGSAFSVLTVREFAAAYVVAQVLATLRFDLTTGPAALRKIAYVMEETAKEEEKP